ncbi:MAG: flagellar biosynthesis protein FlhF [Desulfobacterales bacterium]|nr:flagellar biosynthesis protein FlhF [Desulfobacterales bacterium]
MKVKVFEANDMGTALKMVRESLGPDALILSTRTVRKGGLGLLGRSTLEVTAAIDSADFGSEPPVAGTPAAGDDQGDPELTYDRIWRRRKVIDPLEEEVLELKGHLANLDVEALRTEILELKDLMKSHAALAPAGQSAGPAAESPLMGMIVELSSRGVEPATAEQIVRRAVRQQPLDRSKVSPGEFLSQAIAGSIRCSGPFYGPMSGKPRRIALLGPTGVGKTTTVAKLAADYLLNQGRSLALVTIDIYRIAAAEQLKVYGEIMNIPVDVAGSAQEFKRVMQRHQDKELVLIDTAGRSPRDREGIEALHALIGPESGIENHLVLSVTTRERENHTAVQCFTGVPLKSMILTKLDECDTLGPLLNIHLRHDTPLSYLTDGQRVPEDLLLAEPARVGQLILGAQAGK